MNVNKKKRKGKGLVLLSDTDCPTNEFKHGPSNGKCWGNGHYQCGNCIHYRNDFKKLGQGYIDAVHNLQGQMTFNVVE